MFMLIVGCNSIAKNEAISEQVGASISSEPVYATNDPTYIPLALPAAKADSSSEYKARVNAFYDHPFTEMYY